jgi:branched-subunit amino acid transport protein AzlD
MLMHLILIKRAPNGNQIGPLDKYLGSKVFFIIIIYIYYSIIIYNKSVGYDRLIT